MNPPRLAVFALGSTRAFGEAIGAHLGVALQPHEEREFTDGEHKARPLESVRGLDAYVIHSLHGDASQSVNDKLCRLLFFLGAVRDAGAARVTAVTPYLCYARKDRRSQPRDPITTRYVAALFEALGVDRIVTMDVHNLAAFENAFRLWTEHLEAKTLFAEHFARIIGDEDAVVVSPDSGGVKRAEAFRQALETILRRPVRNAFVEKYRSAGIVSGGALVGDVGGRTAIVIDDLISSGTTLARAAEVCRARGAARVHAAATHGVFSANAGEILATPALDRIVITDSIAGADAGGDFGGRLTRLDSSRLFATAIAQLHADGSPRDPTS